MANKKITDLVEITSAANVDVLPIVDVSADVTNKIKVENLPISTATQTALDAKQATLVSGTNIKTINSTSLLGSGDIAISANPAGTAGQIQFSDGSAFAADSNLYWDNTNKRLGVGETTPTARVQIKGEGTTSSSNSVIVQNSAGTESFSIKDNGNILFHTGVIDITSQRLLSVSSQWSLGSFSQLGARLGIKGSGSTSATTSLLVQNSSGNNALKVADNGVITIGGDLTSGEQLNIYGNYGTRFRILTNSILDSIGGTILNAGVDYSSSNNLILASKGINSTTNVYVIPSSFTSLSGSVLVNTTTDVASSVLTVNSTTKGFLPPRMTTTQKNAISTPAAGLQLYDSTISRPCVYTTAWESLTSSDSASPTAVYKFWSGTAAQYAALTPDANTVYFVS